MTGFDPTSLERAAKAARELDASKNARSAVDLVKTQETTKQVRRLVALMNSTSASFRCVYAQRWGSF